MSGLALSRINKVAIATQILSPGFMNSVRHWGPRGNDFPFYKESCKLTNHNVNLWRILIGSCQEKKG